MRRSSSPNPRDLSRSYDAFDTLLDKAFASPITPAVTGLSFPSPIESPADPSGRHNPVLMGMESDTSSSTIHHGRSSSHDSGEPVTPTDYQSLDLLWGSLRQQKELKMAKEPLKIKSFENASMEIPALEPRPAPQTAPRHSLKKQKSIATFRESLDGRTMMAIFSMPGLTKQDVHVSFQRNRLVITWDIVHVSEREEDGLVVRERREKTYNRTIPLPEGTRFEEIRAAMDGRHLILRYPNMRTVRAEPRSRSRDHHGSS